MSASWQLIKYLTVAAQGANVMWEAFGIETIEVHSRPVPADQRLKVVGRGDPW
jgi:hypothetical protein